MKNKKKLSLIMTLSLLGTLLIYAYNKIIFVMAVSKERLYTTNKNFYNWRFGKIFYSVKGSGSPILLVHDLTCYSSGYEWDKVVGELSKNHTVYTIDLLGCGRSDKPKLTYTSYLYVQMLTEFIKNVIKHKTSIIVTGNSSASVIMTCFIDQQLVDNLILVNPTEVSSFTKYPKKRNNLLKYIIDTPIIGTFIYNICTSKTKIKSALTKRVFSDTTNASSKITEAFYEGAHLGGYSTKYLLSSIKCNYTNININHALKEINNNIQILIGENEKDRNEIIESYTSLNPSIEVDIIPDSKHLPQLENAEYFVNSCNIYL